MGDDAQHPTLAVNNLGSTPVFATNTPRPKIEEDLVDLEGSLNQHALAGHFTTCVGIPVDYFNIWCEEGIRRRLLQAPFGALQTMPGTVFKYG